MSGYKRIKLEQQYRNLSLDIIHEVIRHLIPSHLLEQLVHESFYRLQAPHETLPNYVFSIKEAAMCLRLKRFEGEITGAITEGLMPEERSRLVFQKLPSTFAEIDVLTE